MTTAFKAVKLWRHENVNPDGTFLTERGAVNTEPMISFGSEHGHHYIVVNTGRTEDRVVEGFTFEFDSGNDVLVFRNDGSLDKEITDRLGFDRAVSLGLVTSNVLVN